MASWHCNAARRAREGEATLSAKVENTSRPAPKKTRFRRQLTKRRASKFPSLPLPPKQGYGELWATNLRTALVTCSGMFQLQSCTDSKTSLF